MTTVLLAKFEFRGGPKTFAQRIRPALKRIPGIILKADEKSNFDVELAIVNKKTLHSKPYVLRLDGCYYREKDMFKNANIIGSTRHADHIVFQSKFSAEMCLTLLRIQPKQYDIIHNGIELDWVYSIKPAEYIKTGSFVSCSDWKRRDNKRPISMIRGFIKSGTDRHLYIVGKTFSQWVQEYNYPNVHFLGEQSPEQVIAIMKACDYQIHLCHIDSCPNAVIEGLACGLNVLCTNLGGTKELIKENGVVLEVDKWDFTPQNFRELDNVPSDIVAEGIHRLLRIKERANRRDLDIKITAQKYASILTKYGK